MAVWAGLNPIMASAEVEGGARLFHRRAQANTWGALIAHATFAAEHPEVVGRVLARCAQARARAVANSRGLQLPCRVGLGHKTGLSSPSHCKNKNLQTIRIIGFRAQARSCAGPAWLAG